MPEKVTKEEFEAGWKSWSTKLTVIRVDIVFWIHNSCTAWEASEMWPKNIAFPCATSHRRHTDLRGVTSLHLALDVSREGLAKDGQS